MNKDTCLVVRGVMPAHASRASRAYRVSAPSRLLRGVAAAVRVRADAGSQLEPRLSFTTWRDDRHARAGMALGEQVEAVADVRHRFDAQVGAARGAMHDDV